MMQKVLVFIVMTFILAVAHNSYSAVKPSPLEPFFFESYQYEITWFGINAGKGKINIYPIKEQDKIIKIRLEGIVESSEWFSWMYYVRDLVEVDLDPVTLKPLEMRVDYSEGKKVSRKSRYVFNHLTGEVESFGDKNRIAQLKGDFTDMFGGLFLLRLHDFSNGKDFSKMVVDGRRVYQVTALFERDVILDTVLGDKLCMEIKPSTIKLELLGKNQTPQNLSVFLTKDQHKVPVLARGDLKIGSLVAKLKSWQVVS